MGREAELSFSSAFHHYRRVRSRPRGKGWAADLMIARIDDALDALMAIPSPSRRAFGMKMRILEFEYGLEAQPRHLAALYADLTIISALLGESIWRAWPTG